MRTASDGGDKGASDSRSGGDAASRGDGGALQKHCCFSYRIGFAPGNEDDSGMRGRGCCRGICEDGLIWVEVGTWTHPGNSIVQLKLLYSQPRDLSSSYYSR